MESIFSIRLKEERLKNNLTQQQLADLINEKRKEFDNSDIKISRVSITRYENGTRTPDYSTLCLVSIILNTDLDYLLGKSNGKHLQSINNELNDFIVYVDKVIKEDNSETNDLLWSIINDFYNTLKQGIENNFLKELKSLISTFNGFINYSVNTDDSNTLNEIDILFRTLKKYNFNKTLLENNIQLLNEYKIEEKHYTEQRILSKLGNTDILDNIKNKQNDLQQQIYKIKEEQRKFQQLLNQLNYNIKE